MNNLPLASFVCITFNRPELLNELLYCFLAQDYENKELIIINDKSDIKYVYDDPKVIIYNLSERFISIGQKRNYSRNVVNGDFIFNTDDDDIYYSNHISRLLNYHLEHMEFDIIGNAIGYCSENNENIRTWKINVPFNGTSIKKEYFKKNYFPHYKSCGEDVDFIKNAKISLIDDGKSTFHYRWGLNITHVSSIMGIGAGTYDSIGYGAIIGNIQTIKLNPMLFEKTKLYYK